ncbi:leucine rich repeat-containing protein [Toxoplasma gondii]|uniref:Leucine rich repeat-containing protein n=4 Tax=Toxoplasma gondii TaxID=5811 RepID=A0A7J6KAS6_TOXGO|nr:leucine rich repeat-containing protein [Toxoplasma gondii]
MRPPLGTPLFFPSSAPSSPASVRAADATPRGEAALGCVDVAKPECMSPETSRGLELPPLQALPADALRLETRRSGLLVSRAPTLTEEDASQFVAALHARAVAQYRARASRSQPRGGDACADDIFPTGAPDRAGETSGRRSDGAEDEERPDRDILGVALSGVALNDDSLAILVTCMLRSTFLRVIDLSDNRLTDDSVCILAECLPCLPHLRVLSLSRNRLTAVSIVKAAKAFFPDLSNLPSQKQGASRRELARDVEPPGAAGAGQTTHADEPSEVFHLDLSDNLVGPEGCCAIAETIKCNSCPARLYLRNVGGGCAGLLPLMATESFLKALDFSHTDISPGPPSCAVQEPPSCAVQEPPGASFLHSLRSFSSSSASSCRTAGAVSATRSCSLKKQSAAAPSPPAGEKPKRNGKGYLFRTFQRSRLGRGSPAADAEENAWRLESAALEPGGEGRRAGARGSPASRKRRDEEEWSDELDDYCLQDERDARSRNSLTGGDLQMLLCVAEGLAHLLTSAGALQELNLSYCTWSFADYEETGAEPTGSVHYADQLVDILAEALKGTSSLRSLACAGNGMTAVGLRRLCEGLASPTCRLEELNVACNDLQEVLPLAELLLTNRTIRILDVANCMLPSEAVDQLAAALEENTTLSVLVLAHNSLQPSALLRLSQALKIQQQKIVNADRAEDEERADDKREEECGPAETRKQSAETAKATEGGATRRENQQGSAECVCRLAEQRRPPCCCCWWGSPPNPFNDPSSFSPRMSLAPAARQRLLSLRRRCMLHVLARQEAFASSVSPAASLDVCEVCGGLWGEAEDAAGAGKGKKPVLHAGLDMELASVSLASTPARGLRMLDLSFTTPHDGSALRPLAAALPDLPHLLFLDVSSCSMDVSTVDLFRAAAASRVSPFPSFCSSASPSSSYSPFAPFSPSSASLPVTFPYALCIRGLPLTAIRLDEDEESVDREDAPCTPPQGPSSPLPVSSASPLSSCSSSAPLASSGGIEESGGGGEAGAHAVCCASDWPGEAAVSADGRRRRGSSSSGEASSQTSRLETLRLPEVGGSAAAWRPPDERTETAPPTAEALEDEQQLLSLYSRELSPILPPRQQAQLKALEELHAQQILLQRKREELEKSLLSQLKADDTHADAAEELPPLQDPVDWLHTLSEPETSERTGRSEAKSERRSTSKEKTSFNSEKQKSNRETGLSDNSREEES